MVSTESQVIMSASAQVPSVAAHGAVQPCPCRPALRLASALHGHHRAVRTAAGQQAAVGVAGHRVPGVASFGTGAHGAVHKPADGPLGGEQLLAAAGAVGDDDD